MAQKSKEQTDIAGTLIWKDGAFMMLLCCSILMLISFFQLLFTLPLYLKEVIGWSEAAVGYFFAINGAMVFVLEMPLVHTVETRWKTFPALATGASMIGFALVSLLLPLPVIIVLSMYMILVSIGEIISFPFITSAAIRLSKPETLGKYMGVVSMMFSVAFIIAPILGTQCIEHFGYDMTWLVLGLLGMLAGPGYIYVRSLFLSK